MLLPVFAAAAEAVSEDEAQGLGVDAYLYFYPLVTMDITRTNSPTRDPPPGGSVDR
jgi:hypothetical protein